MGFENVPFDVQFNTSFDNRSGSICIDVWKSTQHSSIRKKFGSSNIREVKDRDREKKWKEAQYTDRRRHATPNSIKAGDIVVAKRIIKDNKLSSNYSPEELEVIRRSGPDVTLQSKESGKMFHRNVSHLKPIVPQTTVTDERNNLQIYYTCKV